MTKILEENYSMKIYLIPSVLTLLITGVTINYLRIRYNFLSLSLNFILQIKALFLLIQFRFDFLKTFTFLSDLSKEKGYFCLKILNKNFVFISHPEYLQDWLTDPENTDRPFVSDGLNGLVDDSFFVRNGEKWRTKRNVFNNLLTQNILKKYLPIMEYNSKLLLKILYEKMEQEWILITPLLSFYHYKIALETFLDCPRNSPAITTYSVYEKYFDVILKNFSTRAFNIFLQNDYIFKFTSNGRACFLAINQIRNIVGKEVERRMDMMKKKENNETNPEFGIGTTEYILTFHKSDPDFTKENIISDVIILLASAEHSTKLTLSYALHQLGKHPDIQKNIQNELDSVFQNASCDSFSENLHKMKYLECVIKESMRLCPLAPLISKIIKKDYNFDNKLIPKNSYCIISMNNIHSNPKTFPNPEDFDPDRHFADNCSKQHPFSFIPFLKGTRMCIGNRFAMMSMKITLAIIFRNFYVESLPEKFERTTNGFFTDIKVPIKIKLKPRETVKAE